MPHTVHTVHIVHTVAQTRAVIATTWKTKLVQSYGFVFYFLETPLRQQTHHPNTAIFPHLKIASANWTSKRLFDTTKGDSRGPHMCWYPFVLLHLKGKHLLANWTCHCVYHLTLTPTPLFLLLLLFCCRKQAVNVWSTDETCDCKQKQLGCRPRSAGDCRACDFTWTH